MPQNKRPQPLYGIHHALWDGVAKYCKGRYEPLCREEFHLLVAIASKPEILSRKNSCRKQIEDFGILFAEHPDRVLDLLQFMRKELADQRCTAAGKVRQFLLTHSVVWVKKLPSGQIVESPDGKMRAVSDLRAKDLAQLLFKSKTSSNVLESVKTERQLLCDKLDGREVWEHPEMIRYQKTGVASKALRSLLKSKGMKLPKGIK